MSAAATEGNTARKIFLSYRRSDSAGHARHFYTRLEALFPGRVFYDLETIPLGADFPHRIDRAISESGAFIALISPDWLFDGAERSVFFEGDFVCLEVAAALRVGIEIFPVLVGGAEMPGATKLPDALKRLSPKNAIGLDGASYNGEFERLVQELEKHIGPRQKTGPAPISQVSPDSPLVALPPSQLDFVERPGLMAELQVLVEKPSVRLLRGEPGTGKSRLAAHFGRQSAGKFEAVVFQFCGEDRRAADAASIGVELAAKLRLDVGALDPAKQLEAAKDWLHNRRSLLILDDVWDAGLVEQFADGEPCSLLVTSRLLLMPIPASQTVVVGGLTEDETMELFREHLPDWLPQHGSVLKEFAARVERLPYALAVAAYLLKESTAHPIEAIAEVEKASLEHGMLSLPKLLEKAVARHAGDAQKLLDVIATCTEGGAWLPFVAEVVGFDLEHSRRCINELRKASLLRINIEEQWLGLHAELRRYLRRSTGSNLQARHAASVSAWLQTWRKEENWLRVVPIREEILYALRFLASLGADTFHDVAFYAFDFGFGAGFLSLAYEVADLGLTQARQQSSLRREAMWSVNQPAILARWGRHREALEGFRVGENLARQISDPRGVASALGGKGLALQGLKEWKDALGTHRVEQLIYEQLHDDDGLATSYGNQAMALRELGEYDESLALHKLEEGLRDKRNDPRGVALSIGNQALLFMNWGRGSEAMELLQKQEVMCKELGDPAGLARSYINQAILSAQQGDREEAYRLGKLALGLFSEVGMAGEVEVTRGVLSTLTNPTSPG